MKTPAQHQKNRTRKDIIARRMITFFGIGVLATLVVMIWHLFSQTLPLFMTPNLTYENSLNLSTIKLMSAGNVNNNGLLVTRNDECGLDFVRPTDLSTIEKRYSADCGNTLLIAEDKGKRWLFDIAQNGELNISTIDPQGVSSLENHNKALSVFLPDWGTALSYQVSISEPHFAILASDNTRQAIFWGKFTNEAIQLFKPEIRVKQKGESLVFLPAYQSKLTFFENSFETQLRQNKLKQSYQIDKTITTVLPLDENRSIFVGSEHLLTRWVLFNEGGRFLYAPSYTIHLNDNETPIEVKAHAETNGAVMITNQQRILLFNRVSGEIFDSIALDMQPQAISFVGNTVYVTFPQKVDVFRLKNRAGIVTINTLFTKQAYEGYQYKEHIYQTTTGSDFNEAKYALAPLFVGSIKAALSALIIALPIALGAAIFTGYFAPNYWRNRIKSTIEMLEAIPSVMLGFIAAIFLIPIAEKLLIAIGLFILTVPILAMGLAFLQNIYANRLPRSLRFSVQALLACLSVSTWAIFCFYLAPGIMVFTPVFLGLTKTTLIVSIALGVAISPTIYTLAEDAIYSVPASLKNASFALGATKLQTLNNVVVRFAMPGLVASVMLGFGRAIGETMIVLMITGNSPIPDWSLFESLRALTANIAIELTEAEVGSALYTVLFFTASMLFVFTFVFNTVAEGLRYKMRKQVNYV